MSNTAPYSFLGLLVASILTGCFYGSYATARYSLSVDNVETLKEFKGKTVGVGLFTSAERSITKLACRGVGPIKPPDGEPFAEYIQKALINDMKMAEIYSRNAPVRLLGVLNDIDFSSGPGSGYWDISLTVTSSNGKSLTIKERYLFDSQLDALSACTQTALAFMPATKI